MVEFYDDDLRGVWIPDTSVIDNGTTYVTVAHVFDAAGNDTCCSFFGITESEHAEGNTAA